MESVADPPPPLWTEWQTRVKTLTYRNYVVDGKSEFFIEKYLILTMEAKTKYHQFHLNTNRDENW